MKGRIFKIERGAIHDGPGIRTVVFLKGCPLRCDWCSTPESQSISRELAYYEEKCQKCGDCVQSCSVHAIDLSDAFGARTDMTRCENCGECVLACSYGARKMIGETLTVEEVLEIVNKDVVFYKNSGGGVTLSGGEPTIQPEFAMGILKASKEQGIHTAMETCGYVRWEVLESLLNYLDLLYIDFKQSSAARHKSLTGKGNALILENIKKAAGTHHDTKLIIRLPIIPEINDDHRGIKQSAKILSCIEGIHAIELLPYHKYGVGTYKALSRTYRLPRTKRPADDSIHELKGVIENYGMPVNIMG